MSQHRGELLERDGVCGWRIGSRVDPVGDTSVDNHTLCCQFTLYATPLDVFFQPCGLCGGEHRQAQPLDLRVLRGCGGTVDEGHSSGSVG